MITATEQPQMGLTFEQVWAALMKTDAQMKAQFEKTQAQFEKTEAQLKARFEETDAQLKARFEKTDAQIEKMSARVDKTSANVDKMSAKVDRVSENVGGLNRSMGEIIETLIAARLWEKFNEYPYNLKRAYQRIPLYDENNQVLSDIDILLSDGDYAMAVEIKRELDKEKDVDHHLRRMELIKKYPPAECKGKKLLGAMAGGVVDADVQDYAHSAGFFVLELTGESVRLAERPEAFTPRQW